ncbi:MAG: type III pantothenate kinase [Bacteroidetes bacterium]|nr:type III pantothenate kinase [Bacteroidota bacterium]MCL1968806.1 type III pantothenate kinase [Bacteroidota bacterium]
MNLVIDIGNTLRKIAVFNNDECVYCQSFSVITRDLLTSILNQFSIENSIISSVADVDVQVTEFLKTNTKLIHYTHQTKLPVTLLYQSVATLGLDRIANAVGAASMFRNRNVLSIQAGTCLVFDFVNEKGAYFGGSISPGMKMRFEALHEKTKKLPLIREHEKDIHFLGMNTEESILSGVIVGMCCEIDGLINEYKAQFNALVVLFSGGDAALLQKSIKNTIFAAPNVVLKGLNEIIKYNV